MKRNLLAFVCVYVLTIGVVAAQVVLSGGENNYSEEKGIIYDKEVAVDLKILQTNGWALGINFGELKSYYRTTYWGVELGEIKHIKEDRTSTEGGLLFVTSSSGGSYIYGKQNNLYVIRASYGEKRYFSEKGKKNGLAIGVNYSVGPSIGLLKPYYLDLLYLDDGSPSGLKKESQKYSAENEDVFIDRRFISDATGFYKGLGELSIVPGIQAKVAAHFDWGAFGESVRAIEAGAVVDFYFQKVPLMVESANIQNVKNSPVFINLYINLQLGKRK